MKFGLSFLPDSTESVKPAHQYFDEIIQLSLLAEKHGLHYIKMTEHYLNPYGGYSPDPLCFLAALAARTRRIRLMTGCLLPAFSHPIQLASRVSMLDAMSHGRMEVGFARGYLPYEFDAFEIDLDESRDRYEQSVQVIQRLWSEEVVTESTPYFSFHEASILPRSVQLPHPPIWGAAVNARASFAWLGEQGHGLLVTPPLSSWSLFQDKLNLYRELYSKKKETDPSIALSIPILVCRSKKVAYQKAEIYLGNYLSVWRAAVSSWRRKLSCDYPGYERLYYFLNSLTPCKMIETQMALVGSPDSVYQSLFELSHRLHVNQFLFQLDFGSQPFEVSVNTLCLLIDCIIPRLNQAKGNSA